MSRSSLIIIGLSVVFALAVLLRARRMRISERHTFLWLLVAGVVATLALWREAIDRLAEAMGIFYAPSALFLLTSGALLWLVYRQSLDLADQREKVQRLAQEVALLTAELDLRRGDSE